MFLAIEKVETEEKKFDGIYYTGRAEITRDKRRLDVFMRCFWWLAVAAFLLLVPLGIVPPYLALMLLSFVLFSRLYTRLPLYKKANRLCLDGSQKYLEYGNKPFRVRYFPRYWNGFWKTLFGYPGVHQYKEQGFFGYEHQITVNPINFYEKITSGGDQRKVECTALLGGMRLYPDDRALQQPTLIFSEHKQLNDDEIECSFDTGGMIFSYANLEGAYENRNAPGIAFLINIRAPTKLFERIIEFCKDKRSFKFSFLFPDNQLFSLWENQTASTLNVLYLEEQDREKFDSIREHQEYMKSSYAIFAKLHVDKYQDLTNLRKTNPNSALPAFIEAPNV